ncbi:co-chaperone HscB [Micromonospora sp. LOL_021]|uniref:co-chaperone HscB n=1 Tax=Micromonospora sp. LOL_021 TaxID=3345417 RepID=UPI003A8943F6
MSVVDFLVRAAGEFRRGGYVFTGFHWPVLAARLAHQLPGEPFAEVYEAGAVCDRPAATVATSTTDHHAYADAVAWRGTSSDVLLCLAARCDRVVLDAANVDLAGRINATMVGAGEPPQVRLAGGGGAADVAAAARELVLLHGGADPTRLAARVQHVTAAPGPAAPVRVHTRWGTLCLGARPRLVDLVDTAGTDVFLRRLTDLGVPVDWARPVAPVPPAARRAARRTLAEAADRGYRVARQALAEKTGPVHLATDDGGQP